MATNIIVARGGVEYVPPISLAKDIGGTYSTPPRATIIFVAIKTGCTNNNIYGK